VHEIEGSRAQFKVFSKHEQISGRTSKRKPAFGQFLKKKKKKKKKKERKLRKPKDPRGGSECVGWVEMRKTGVEKKHKMKKKEMISKISAAGKNIKKKTTKRGAGGSKGPVT